MNDIHILDSIRLTLESMGIAVIQIEALANGQFIVEGIGPIPGTDKVGHFVRAMALLLVLQ